MTVDDDRLGEQVVVVFLATPRDGHLNHLPGAGVAFGHGARMCPLGTLTPMPTVATDPRAQSRARVGNGSLGALQTDFGPKPMVPAPR